MKIFWFDTETTGLDPYHIEIIQLAALIEENGEIIARKTFEAQPFNWFTISASALDVNGYTKSDLKNFELNQMTFLDELVKFFNENQRDYKDNIVPLDIM